MKYKSLALAAAALMAGMLSFGGAQATNVMTGSSTPTGITKMDNGNVQQASHRKWRRSWRHNNRWRGGRRSGIFLGFGLSPFGGFGYPYGGYGYPYGYGYGSDPYYGSYYQPYYAPSYSYYRPVRASRHVRYCLNRYRTYSVRSNTFIGFDGYRHRCRSPYRY